MNYFEMYQEKVKEYKFHDTHIPGIIRYLMVNGHIPVTEEHLDLMGDVDFHIDAKYLPENMRKGLEEHYLKDPWAGEYEEETELEHHETKSHSLEGVWFKGGEVVDFTVNVVRKVTVETTYHFREPDPEDPVEEYYECFRDMAPDERVQQHWEKSNICPHCGYTAEESEGYSELYEDGSCRIIFSGDGRPGTCCGKAFYVLHPDYKQPDPCNGCKDICGPCEVGKDYVCEDCGNGVSDGGYVKLEDDTVLCQACWDKISKPQWTNKLCSECKSEYYANCPCDGKPQPHCDEPRMKKEGYPKEMLDALIKQDKKRIDKYDKEGKYDATI